MSIAGMSLEKALVEIMAERARQDRMWGVTNHHPTQWFAIIGEEYGKMCKGYNDYTFSESYSDLEDMQRRAITVAATCVAMLECLERVGNERLAP